jgi:hypothetical protein
MRLALQAASAPTSLQHVILRRPHAPTTASALRATSVAVPDAAISIDKTSELTQLTGQRFSLSSQGSLQFDSSAVEQTTADQRTLAYDELIAICCKKRHWDAVVALWKSLFAEKLLPTERSCEKAMLAFTKLEQPPPAVLQVFDRLLTVQPKPSVFALQSAVYAASRAADVVLMQKIIALHDTTDEDNRLPTWAYLTALRTFSDASMQQESCSMLSAVLSSSDDAATHSKAYKAAMSACRNSGDYPAALALLRQMSERSVPADGAHYSAVVAAVTRTAAGSTWQWENSPERCAVIAELWHEMQQRGVAPSGSSCRTAAAAFNQLQQPHNVLVRAVLYIADFTTTQIQGYIQLALRLRCPATALSLLLCVDAIRAAGISG